MTFINEEAERCLLASMVMDNSIIENVFMEISENDIASQNNRLIYLAVQKLRAQKVGVDIKTLVEMTIGKVNPAEVATLSDVVPTGENWSFYAKKVKAHALYRGYWALIEKAKTYNPDSGIDISEQIVELNKELAKLQESAGTEKLEKTMFEVMLATEKKIDFFIENKGRLTGYKTGFNRLDLS